MRSQLEKIRTIKKLTLALLIAAVFNVPVAEAIFIPLSEQPGGPLQGGVPYIFRIGDAANGTAVMLQAVVRSRLELEDTLTVSSGDLVDLGFTIPSRASRVIFVLNREVTVAVLDQNGATLIPPRTFSFSTDPDPHLEVVYEIAP
jgi:hypothetical protein